MATEWLLPLAGFAWVTVLPLDRTMCCSPRPGLVLVFAAHSRMCWGSRPVWD
jgi:hypothetical protein